MATCFRGNKYIVLANHLNKNKKIHGEAFNFGLMINQIMT